MDKQKLFAELLKKRGINAPGGAVLTRQDDPGPYPLSFTQRRIWFLQQFDTGSAAYNDPTALRIKGPLNIPILEQVLNKIMQRHRVLCMIFPSQKGQPVQTPHKNPKITISIEKPEKPPGQTKEKPINQLVNQFASQPFNLDKDLPVRATLLKIAERDYVLVVNIHHIVLDGWSKGIMLQELTVLYEAFVEGKPCPFSELPVQYTDYVHWHHEWLQGKLVETQLAYWKEKLAGAPPLLELPTDYPRPNLPSGKGSLEPFSISRWKYQALIELAKQEGVTLFMVLMAAYNTMLYRYTNQEDILMGTPTAGRNRVELENLMGLFVNTLVIRADLSGIPTFKDLLPRVRATALAAYAHQDIPFEKLVEELNPQRNLSITPLFQVMFQLQNAPMPPAHISGLTITPIQIDTGYSQVDLSLTLWEEDWIMKGTFEYNTGLYQSETIKRMKAHFQVLLAGIIHDRSQKISHLPLLTEKEKKQLIVEWNNTGCDYPVGSGIYELYATSAAKNPDQEAVIFNDRQMSYRQLNQKANRLARDLQRFGLGPESLAAIGMENPLELIVGIIGILKTGAAYIPIDPGYPDERLKAILKDAQPRVFITQASLLNRFAGYSGKILYMDAGTGGFSSEKTESTGNRQYYFQPHHAACVIYTSGTTGEPKGILMSSRNIINLIFSFHRSYRPGPGDRILPLTSIASASFVGEILPMLTSGGAVVLTDKVHLLDMKQLQVFLSGNNITILSTVPSMIAQLNTNAWQPEVLRLLLSGGEALSAGDIDHLTKTVSIVNGYGLTEAAICSTYIIVNENKSDFSRNPVISAGRPIINTRIYILDKNQHLVPIGIPGEIYIGGAGIARGYLNNPELTAQKFINYELTPIETTSNEKFLRGGAGGAVFSKSAPPFRGSRRQKIFKTGDLGTWLKDGTIKFLGRVDTQVQVHGYRIELAEVETHLGLHPDIQDVKVIDRELAPGDRRLVAYYVTVRENGRKRVSPGSGLLRDWLGKRIPGYMIPAIYTELEAIPLTVNGKVDIAGLPIPSLERPELQVDYQAPESETEKVIARVWAEFLRLDQVGINDNFFDLGGHSLLLTRVHSQLSELVQNKKALTIVDLFRYPTIHSLADYLETGDKAQQSEVQQQETRDRAAKQRQAFSRFAGAARPPKRF